MRAILRLVLQDDKSASRFHQVPLLCLVTAEFEFLRQDPQRSFAVRAVSRNACSRASRALADLGAEVFQCNIDDKEQVKAAMNGAYGAFCITFFWDRRFMKIN